MKKILMGTSALALAGVIGAGEAKAATWDLDWGGFYEASIAYRESDAFDDSGDGVDVLTDSEIIFTPSITLDNGLQFGARVELEADSLVDENVDETYVFVQGPFGIVRLGSTDSAAANMQSNAPDVSWVGASSGSLAGYLMVDEFAGTYVQPGGGDATKIVYFTPRFSGFQLGASYAHDGSESRSAERGSSEDLYTVGANYINSFGAFDISVSGSYSTASLNGTPGVTVAEGIEFDPDNGLTFRFDADQGPTAGREVIREAVAGSNGADGGDHDHYAVSMTLGYAGFSVGASYANSDNEATGAEHDFYDAGVAYRTGPWGASFQYSHGEAENSDNETDQYLAAVDYKLGPGVRAGAYAGYAENDNSGVDTDGFIVGTGFRLDF